MFIDTIGYKTRVGIDIKYYRQIQSPKSCSPPKELFIAALQACVWFLRDVFWAKNNFKVKDLKEKKSAKNNNPGRR